ncbi:ribonuclease HI [Curtobacterium sp. NPDC098951]|uniref:ribonuclease HI n=1 Tax=Curtobacterium sp. NPDC098951 TaxID=3363974 RepID=UPI00383032DE
MAGDRNAVQREGVGTPILNQTAPARAIWTDASHWRGGHTWAWVDDTGNFAHGRGRGFAIDNNEAELWAIVEGLRAVPDRHVVHVTTDSETAAALMLPFADVDGVLSKPMRNSELYRECLEDLAAVTSNKTVVAHWRKGHQSAGSNVAADRLATAARWEDTTFDEWTRDWEHALGALEDGHELPAPCSCGLLLREL